MRSFLKNLFLNTVILWGLAGATPSISYNGFYGLIESALILTVLLILVRPILGLLWAPISLLSVGFLSWVPTFLSFAIFYIFASNYTIGKFYIPAFSYSGVSIPKIQFGNVSTIIIFIIVVSRLRKLIFWVMSEGEDE